MRHRHEAEGKPKSSSVAAGQRGGLWQMDDGRCCQMLQGKVGH